MRLVLLGTTGYHPNENGHTPCMLLPEAGVMFDAGTAIFLAPRLLATPTLDIFLSHAHLDHTIGLTYLFSVIHQHPLERVRVFGEAEKLAAIEEHLFSEFLFPARPPHRDRLADHGLQARSTWRSGTSAARRQVCPSGRLLGAKRQRLPPMRACWATSVEPAEARAVAREFFDRGFKRQKWFFMKGPVDGAEGLKQSIELVRALREELGPEATLMFDGIQYVWKSDDLDYAIELAKGILPYQPHWLEEPLRPDDLEGYTRLKGETGITLASGEHWYTRWNVKPFLDRKIVSFVQSDPEWCGGLTEWLRICELVKAYPGVQVVPHGHHVLAASTCVASQPEQLCPMLEYLVRSRVQFQRCQTRPMVAEAGTFGMGEEPGLGPSPDESRLSRL